MTLSRIFGQDPIGSTATGIKTKFPSFSWRISENFDLRFARLRNITLLSAQLPEFLFDMMEMQFRLGVSWGLVNSQLGLGKYCVLRKRGKSKQNIL